jgi:TolA-binding protein
MLEAFLQFPLTLSSIRRPTPSSVMSSDASASSSPSASSEASPAPATLEEVRAQGIEDGRAGTDAPSPYESFLAMGVARQRIEEALDVLQARLDTVTTALDRVRTLRRETASSQAALEELEAQKTETRQRLDDVETSLEAIQEEQAAKRRRGSVLYAALYSVAGFFFVAGDIVMSREIVASALKIRGEVESWVFAVGLAMLAVLLKPAYDRLVERDYWAGRSPLFAGVISVCALGALGTLWVLGAFRSAAFANSNRIQRLTSELAQTSDPAAIQELQRQISGLQQDLIEGPFAFWAFALSGVLFAVAGAVCLGIGFTHLRAAYHLRYQLYRARRRLTQKREDLTDTLRDVEARIRERRVQLAEQRQALSDHDSIGELEARRETLRTRRRRLRNERAEVQSQRLQSLYRRGVCRGRSGDDAESGRAGDGAVTVGAPDADDPSAPDDPAYIGIRNRLPRADGADADRDR